MLRSKKVLLIAAIFCACGMGSRAANIQWNPETTYTIPNDGNTYYVDFTKTLTAALSNTGTLEIRTDGHIISPSNSARISNGTLSSVTSTINIIGGTIDLNGTGQIYNGAAASATGILNLSSGTINVSSTGSILNSATANTTATINISGGTLNLLGQVSNGQSGSSTVTINISGGTINHSSGDLFNITSSTTSGTINLSGGTYNLSGTGVVENGATTSATGTINITGGTFNQTGGTFTNAKYDSSAGIINISGGTFTQAGGIFYNADANAATGTLTVSNGTFELSGGTFRNADHASGTGTLNVTGGLLKVSGGTLNNASETSSTGTISITLGTLNLSSGTIANAFGSGSTGNFTISGQSQFVLGSGSITAGVTGSPTNNITIFGHSFSSGIASSTMTVGSTLTIPARGGLHINTGGTLDNNGTVVVNGQLSLLAGTIDNAGGTITNNGVFLQDSSGTYVNPAPSGGTTYDTTAATNEIPLESILTIPNGYTLNVSSNQTFLTNGVVSNQSAGSIDIYGTMYTYSTLENGTPGISGTININRGGQLALLGGNLINRNSNSSINVNSGGKLYNYHGLADTRNGSITTNSGGLFNNVYGALWGSVTDTNGVFIGDSEITLQNNLSIDYTWTITEKATLNGDGNKITFGTDGAILIEGADASLRIKNAIVENISGNQIRCTDDTTTLSIDDVIWIQDANYSFSKGTISVNGKWLVSGADTSFTYSSDQASTIQQNAELIFDLDVTFIYDSPATTNLAMIDGTSILHFNGSTLKAEDSLRLTKGKIIFDENTTFSIDSGKNVYFGNSSAPDNVTLKFGKNSQLAIAGASDALVNQNV